MTQYVMPPEGEASKMMWYTCQGGGSSSVYCSCGITHGIEGDDITDFEYIKYIELDNNLYVQDCHGCNKRLARYEQFIWSNRDSIRRYLRTRIDQEAEWANHEQMLNKLAGM